jgi:putative transposase
LEIVCWNGAAVRVAFALDTCDREVMAWCATTGGISGEMIRDLMLKSVERRFGSTRVPQPIQSSVKPPSSSSAIFSHPAMC